MRHGATNAWPLGRWGLPAALAVLLLGAAGAPAARAFEARVAASLAPTGPVWVGQKVLLRIDLKSDAYRFQDQRIRLPDVPGALLLEDAVETVKLSESVDGETWQVLRYEYPLFPQRSERLEIGPVTVGFSVAGGFDSQPESFSLQTSKQVVVARAPAGVTDVSRLVTTTDFSVRVELDPEAEDLQVGDAVTRRIVRRAEDLTAMAFSPLVTPDLPGVAIYEEAPEIEESRNRGEMVGTRIDTTTFVLQQAGRFIVPGFEFEWWDPERQRLATESVPELELEVAANPLWSRAPASLGEAGAGTLSWIEAHPWRVAALGLMTVVMAIALFRVWPGIWLRLAHWHETREDREAARFARLARACRDDDPVEAYNAFRAWIESLAEGSVAVLHDETLAREVERVQTALVGQEEGWTGRALVHAARHARRRRRPGPQGSRHPALRDLNPTARPSTRFGTG